MSTDQLVHPTSVATQLPGVRLLDAIPEMQLGVPPQERESARAQVLVPKKTWPEGPFHALGTREGAHPFALVILSGALLSTTHLSGRKATEIFGEGDVVDAGPPSSAVDAPVEWLVHEPLTVAVLDGRFRVAARRWPYLHDVVYARLARQRKAAAAHIAMLHLPRVEERVLALFEQLSERWGSVTPEGVVVRLRLSHHLIGQLVGSRRPTVTLALAELAAAGALVRRDIDEWLLSRPQSAAA